MTKTIDPSQSGWRRREQATAATGRGWHGWRAFIVGSLVAAVAVVIPEACILQSEPVPGQKGDRGLAGEAGTPGATTVAMDGINVPIQQLADLVVTQQQAIVALQAEVQELKSVNEFDCPRGYSLDAKPFVAATPSSVLCRNGDDEVVKVGTGSASFWVDRYEASVWEGSILRFGEVDDSGAGATFSKNGQSTVPWVAKSVSGVRPARAVTWFQAQAACRAGGKRLPTGSEWLAAAQGTNDPQVGNDGHQNFKCNTYSAEGPRATGRGGDPAGDRFADGCFSVWGAEDMIGNLWEWTDEWYASVHGLALSVSQGSLTEINTAALTPWPDDSYNGDATWAILSTSSNPGGAGATGLPSAAFRGGQSADGTRSGIFALDLNHGPADLDSGLGFRCVLP